MMAVGTLEGSEYSAGADTSLPAEAMEDGPEIPFHSPSESMGSCSSGKVTLPVDDLVLGELNPEKDSELFSDSVGAKTLGGSICIESESENPSHSASGDVSLQGVAAERLPCILGFRGDDNEDIASLDFMAVSSSI